MNETMSEAQLLWLVADKAEQCAAHDIGLAVLLRRLAAVSSGNGKDHPGKIVMVAESAERSAASLLAFITSIRMRAVALEAQSRQQQTKINATAQRIANNEMLAGTVETAGVQAADLGGDGRDVDRPGRGNARDPTGRRPFSAATTASARSDCPGTTASLTRGRPSRRQPSPRRTCRHCAVIPAARILRRHAHRRERDARVPGEDAGSQAERRQRRGEGRRGYVPVRLPPARAAGRVVTPAPRPSPRPRSQAEGTGAVGVCGWPLAWDVPDRRPSPDSRSSGPTVESGKFTA
jgi:hypothetical protein